jgi:hypothetical protein
MLGGQPGGRSLETTKSRRCRDFVVVVFFAGLIPNS